MSYQKPNTIRCPKCGFEIDVNEVLYHEIEEQIRSQYLKEKEQLLNELQQKREKIENEIRLREKELEKAKAELEDIIKKEVDKKIEEERNSLLKQRQQIEEERAKMFEKIEEERNSLLKQRQQIEEERTKMFEKVEEERNSLLKQRQQIEEERAKMFEKVELEVANRLKVEKEKLHRQIEQSLKEEYLEQIDLMKKELESKTEEVKELNKLKAELFKLQREKEELREQIILEKEKEFSEKLHQEKERIRKLIEDEIYLKLQEKEKIIEDLRRELESAKRKAEISSQQLQGEIQELELERLLRELYPLDTIEEVKKGQKGADVLQVVRNSSGKECGKIYYESKRTKNFDEKWIKKLKDDNLEVNADILVIVTETMPPKMSSFHLYDGVWICPFNEIKPLSMVLRYTLIRVEEVTIVNQGRESKMELLYSYLTSQEFRNQFEAIIEGFKAIYDGYRKEQLTMEKFWKEREKQLQKVLLNAVHFYGSLKGIAGSSIPDVKMLENQNLMLEEEQS